MNQNTAMRTRRPLSINNSLVHGICNFNCQTCGVNKPSYTGPREFQLRSVTEALIERVKAAGRAGIRVCYIANSGDGEPTLHPEFVQRMAMFGRMIREWDAPGAPVPEVGVVTNGLRLTEPGVLEAVAANSLTLLVSFPTSEPEAYGQLVMGRPEQGVELLSRVLPGIERAMELKAAGWLKRLYFHISPPDREVVLRDFPKTVERLTAMAGRAGLGELDLVLFPATSNRSGLVKNKVKGFSAYPDLFRAFHGKAVNGVRLNLTISYRRFFRKRSEILDLVRSFDLPCMWNAHLFITSGGDSICCNDQAVRSPQGNILRHSIAELMVRKERHRPDAVCAGCDQRPDRLTGSLFARTMGLTGRLRLALARLFSNNPLKETAHAHDQEASQAAQTLVPRDPREAPLPGTGTGLVSRGTPRPIVARHLAARPDKAPSFLEN